MKQDIKALTGIRFFAAFYVFLFHLDARVPLNFLPWQAHNIVKQGALGVNLFFILSGFLLAYSHFKDYPAAEIRDTRFTLQFLFKRFARIYPVYLVTLLLSAGVGIWLHTLPSPLVLGANVLFLQTYYPPVAMDWFGGGGWSIANEIYFYLFFPLLLPCLLRIQRRNNLLLLLGVCAILGFVPGAAYNLLPHIPFTFQYAFPLCRLAEFTAGIITSILVFRFQWRVPSLTALAAIGIAGVYLIYLGPNPRLQGYVVHNWLMIPVITLTLAAVSKQEAGIALSWLGKEPWVYLGKISYCFYMIQIPLSLAVEPLLETGILNPGSKWRGLAWFAFSIIGGAALHHGIEVPLHRYLMSQKNALIPA